MLDGTASPPRPETKTYSASPARQARPSAAATHPERDALGSNDLATWRRATAMLGVLDGESLLAMAPSSAFHLRLELFSITSEEIVVGWGDRGVVQCHGRQVT